MFCIIGSSWRRRLILYLFSFQVDDEKEDEGTEENAMPDEANVGKWL